MFQYKIFSQQGHSSTKYSVSRDIPVQNIQSAGTFQYKIFSQSDTPGQNIQSAGTFQYTLFSLVMAVF
jgi:uncharacterized protein YjdB